MLYDTNVCSNGHLTACTTINIVILYKRIITQQTSIYYVLYIDFNFHNLISVTLNIHLDNTK